MPQGDGNQPRGTAHQPVTQERIDKFLNVLRTTGSSYAASAAATPHGAGEHPGYSTFRDLRKKDPAFALAWREAEAEYVGKLEEAMAKWSTTPRRRPVVSGKTGEVVSYDEQPPDPRLLLASLRRHRPDAWNEKKQLEVSGDIQHQVSGGVTMAQIDAQDVMRLPPKEREQFAELLEQIITLRDEATNVIEHDGPAC